MINIRRTGRRVVFLANWRIQEPAAECNWGKLTSAVENSNKRFNESAPKVPEGVCGSRMCLIGHSSINNLLKAQNIQFLNYYRDDNESFDQWWHRLFSHLASLHSWVGATGCYRFPLLCEISELCPNKLWLVFSHWPPGANHASSVEKTAETLMICSGGSRKLSRICHVSHNHMQVLRGAMQTCASTIILVGGVIYFSSRIKTRWVPHFPTT